MIADQDAHLLQISQILERSKTLSYVTPQEALRLAEDACLLAKDNCTPQLQIAVWLQKMHLLITFGHIHDACHLLLSALVIAENENLESERGNILHHLGIAHYTLGDYPTAIDFWSDCLNLAHEAFLPETRINAHIGIGQIYFACGQHADALRHHQCAAHWLHPHIDDQLRARLLINLIADLNALSRHDEMADLLQEAETLTIKLNHLEYINEVLSYRALFALAKARYAEAHRYIQEGRKLIRFRVWDEIHWAIVTGRTQQAEGYPQAALDSFLHALQIATSLNCGHQVAMIHHDLAACYRELEQTQKAETHHRLYLENYHRLHDPMIYIRLKQLEDQLSIPIGI